MVIEVSLHGSNVNLHGSRLFTLMRIRILICNTDSSNKILNLSSVMVLDFKDSIKKCKLLFFVVEQFLGKITPAQASTTRRISTDL